MRFFNFSSLKKLTYERYGDRLLPRRAFALGLAVTVHVSALLLASLAFTARPDFPPTAAIVTFDAQQASSAEAPESGFPEAAEVPPQPPEATEPTVEQQPQIALPNEKSE
ncbi:MAG: hypothetical protein WA957_13150, partial [Alteraurantiacibacter sp.]